VIGLREFTHNQLNITVPQRPIEPTIRTKLLLASRTKKRPIAALNCRGIGRGAYTTLYIRCAQHDVFIPAIIKLAKKRRQIPRKKDGTRHNIRMRKPTRCPIAIIKHRATPIKGNRHSTDTHKSERSKQIPPSTCTSPTLRFQMRSSRNKNKGHPRQPRSHLILPRRCGRSSTGGAAHRHDEE
ncbi:exo-alpha-sialidase, partial [Trypanosoma cruzi]